jgi:hypothetical protein
MSDQPNNERRRYPRSKTGVPVELRQAHQKYGIQGQTTDLSVSVRPNACLMGLALAS